MTQCHDENDWKWKISILNYKMDFAEWKVSDIKFMNKHEYK